MCFNRKMQSKKDAVAALRCYNQETSDHERELELESIVTGTYQRTGVRTGTWDILACAMSDLVALTKALTLDVQEMDLSKADPEIMREIAREFGSYAYGPVMRIQRMLKRLLYASWKCGFLLSRLMTKFLNSYDTGELNKARLTTLAIYLNFGMYAAQLHCTDRYSMPFFVEINKRGKIYLVYRYLNKSKRQRVIRWNLGLSVPKAAPALYELMLQDIMIRDSLRKEWHPDQTKGSVLYNDK